MADTKDFALVGVAVGGVALAGWLLGNQIEGGASALGKGLASAGSAAADEAQIASAQVGRQGESFGAAFRGSVQEIPGTSPRVSTAGVGDQNPPPRVPVINPRPFINGVPIDRAVPKSRPKRVPPPDTVLITGIERDGFAFFPKENLGFRAGSAARSVQRSVAPPDRAGGVLPGTRNIVDIILGR